MPQRTKAICANFIIMAVLGVRYTLASLGFDAQERTENAQPASAHDSRRPSSHWTFARDLALARSLPRIIW